MAKEDKDKGREPTPLEIMAWDMSRRGMTWKAIAKSLKLSEPTVGNYIKRVKEWVGRDPVAQSAEDEMHSLVPGAIKVYKHKIGDPDDKEALSAARDVLKSYGLIKDKTTVEHGGSVQINLKTEVKKQIENLAAAIGADGDDVSPE